MRESDQDQAFHDDPEYFGLYADIAIHREMLEDRIRTDTYAEAIRLNRKSIQGGVVLDVGMGSGILSLFAAREGAKKVYGVEACRTMAEQVAHIIEANGRAEQIDILQGLMEKVNVPEKVDVIISEWMGYLLLYESMLDSVLFARDHYLKPGGKILPSRCNIFVAPYSDMEREENDQEDLDFWNSLYGFDYSPMKPFVRECMTREPEIAIIPPHFILSKDACVVKSIDIMTVHASDLHVSHEFSFTSMISEVLSGFVVWFDVSFDTDDPNHPILLSTSPESPETHWCQVLLPWTEGPTVTQDQKIEGRIEMKKSSRIPRALDIEIQLTAPVRMSKSFEFQ